MYVHVLPRAIQLLSRAIMRRRWVLVAAIACSGVDMHAQTGVRAGAESRRTDMLPGRIRGVIFDSLAMKPVANATVILVGASRTTTSDAQGHFAFNNVPAGMQTVTHSSALFDSLSLGTLGSVANVLPNQTAVVNITTPSLRTVWTYRCPASNRIGIDSGIVFGELRDASSNVLINRGAATFSWYVISGARFSQNVRGVDADASGKYFACGLPADVAIATNGVSDSAASGRVEYTVGSRRMQRLDLLVSADMLIPESDTIATTDSSGSGAARGKATVRGIVRDSTGKPLANAIVTLTVAQTTVRTDANGRFQLTDLPAGTQTLQVRRVGSAAATQLVQLRTGQVSDVSIVMSSANTLATVNVIGKSAQRLAFEKRRAENFGYAIDSTVLNNRADLLSAFTGRAGTTAKRNGWATRLWVRGLYTAQCEPMTFLDGLPAPMDLVTVLPPDYFRAIEVLIGRPIPDPYFAPNNCGVILFWSRNIKW